jgi:hypothetical protein
MARALPLAWAARERESLVIDRGTGVKPEDVHIECEWSVERPGSDREPLTTKSR